MEELYLVIISKHYLVCLLDSGSPKDLKGNRKSLSKANVELQDRDGDFERSSSMVRKTKKLIEEGKRKRKTIVSPIRMIKLISQMLG